MAHNKDRKIEWHYNEKPPKLGFYLVAYWHNYKSLRQKFVKAAHWDIHAKKWLEPYHVDDEVENVYAWAYLPAAPPMKP